jgi:hypothetical protein
VERLGASGSPRCRNLPSLAARPPQISRKRLCPAQMAEQHGYELAPTAEPAGVALGPVLNDGSLKFTARKQLQHLAENAGYSCHGGGGPPYGSRLSTQTVAEFYCRRSKANLDKSELE